MCLNDDDDNGNGVPDKDEPGPTAGENDLIALTVSIDPGLEGTVTLSAIAGATRIKLYENADRSNPVTLPKSWTVPTTDLPETLYVEGFSVSLAARDIELRVLFTGSGGPCEDRVKLTVIRATIDPVTSGTNPVPINPAIVAPVDMGLDDGTTFEEGNKFELTTLEPNIDLFNLPVSWVFELNSGSIDANMVVAVDANKRGARLDFPLISFGNFGTGRMLFVLGIPPPGSVPVPCASIDTLVRNTVLDIEQKDFRFHVKAHLCHDGQGNASTRTPAEITTMMTDVTKVLSQCGIFVTLSTITITEIDPDYIDLDGTALFDWYFLFDTDEDEIAIDVYFIKTIDLDPNAGCGATAGLTASPENSGIAYEAGIAFADSTCDGPLVGQEAVRTLAHEITHYLLNHNDGETDHVYDPENLMSNVTSNTKRDLDENQCLELRDDYGVD